MGIGIEIIQPSAKLININNLSKEYDNKELPPCYYVMEHIGRICYNSYHKPTTEEELIKFLSHAANRGHRSIFEFGMLHFSMKLFKHDFGRVYDRVKPNKYIKVSYTRYDDDEFILTIKGSPRALIEILENYVTNDQDISLEFFYTLYQSLSDLVPTVLLNWESIESIDNYVIFAERFIDGMSNHHIEDITHIYDSRDMFTKYLFQVQCSRSESHEIVRHRPCSFMQASQRYIRYGEKNPYLICVGTKQMEIIDIVKESALADFERYTKMIESGEKAENARVVLPNCTETKIFIYCDKEEYAHFDRMRTSIFAYPPVKEVFDSVHQQLINKKYI